MATSSNQDSDPAGDQLWASKFVPLPPTDFSAGAMYGGTSGLDDRFGADPFVSPEIWRASSSEDSAKPASAADSTQGAPESICPTVEVVGQASLSASNDSNNAGSPSCVESFDGAETNQPSDPATPPNADWRRKVLTAENQRRFQGQNQTPTTLQNPTLASAILPSQSPRDVSDISLDWFAVPMSDVDVNGHRTDQYWSQFNGDSFVPGVTPIDIQPDCQDFTQRFGSPAEPPSQQLLSDIATSIAQVEAAAVEVSDQRQIDQIAQSRLETPTVGRLAKREVPGDDVEVAAPENYDVTDSLPHLPTQSDKDSVGDPADTHDSEQPIDSPAHYDQLIEVDGQEGYDHLDLTLFDFSQATFFPGCIYLALETSTLRINYRNIDLAIFASDVEVALRSPKISPAGD